MTSVLPIYFNAYAYMLFISKAGHLTMAGPPADHDDSVYDCIIIGGGPAGRSAANTLTRQSYRVALFDSGSYRNDALANGHHPPRENGRKDTECPLSPSSSLHIINTTITRVKQSTDRHFEAVSGDGMTWHGKKLLLATGVRDLVPDIPGYQECWDAGSMYERSLKFAVPIRLLISQLS
jgi:thioredoxin reductase